MFLTILANCCYPIAFLQLLKKITFVYELFFFCFLYVFIHCFYFLSVFLKVSTYFVYLKWNLYIVVFFCFILIHAGDNGVLTSGFEGCEGGFRYTAVGWILIWRSQSFIKCFFMLKIKWFLNFLQKN